MARSDNDGEGQGIGKAHDSDHDGTNPPAPSNVPRLVAFRKEQVEEKRRSKDGRDGDADKDVVGCDADKVVVVDSRRGMQTLDAILLLYVVCSTANGTVRSHTTGI